MSVTNSLSLRVPYRRSGAAPLDYSFPDGPLVKMLLAHIKQGHRILTQSSGKKMVRLFVSKYGNEFSNVTFTHFWTSLMTGGQVDTHGQAYFAPSVARTMFIEEWTASHGEEPETWDGCADIMGNSVSQWFKSYNPSYKRRRMDKAIKAHTRARDL